MRFFKQGLTLRSKFLIVFLIFSLSSLFFSTYLFTREHLKYTYGHIERELNTLVFMTQGALNRTFRYEVLAALDDVMGEVTAHRRVRFAEILDSQGDILYNSAHPNLPKKLQATLQGEQQFFKKCQQNLHLSITLSDDNSSFVACAPVLSNPNAYVGTEYEFLVIEYLIPLTFKDAFISQIPKLVAWLAAVFTVLLIFFWYLNKQVVLPVRRLVTNIEGSNHRKTEPLQPIHGAAEFIAIDQAFRSMLFERDEREAAFIKISTAVEQSKEGVVITNSEGIMEYVNQAVIDNTGYSEAELLGNNPRMLSAGRTPPEVIKTMWETLLSGKAWTGEFYNKHANGNEIIELQTITPLRIGSNEITHYVSVRLDITEQKSAQERLHFLAYFDPLTHLPNRVRILQKLKEQVDLSREQGQYGALLLLNIDRLRVINDGRGYQFGNKVIVALSERLLGADYGAKLGQLGGDNFCLLKSFGCDQHLSLKQVQRLAQQVREHCSEPLYVEDEIISLSVSIGLCMIDGLVNAEQIIRRAETALHKAKEQGGNQCSLYQDAHGEQAEYIFSIEHELKEALKHNQLRCYLQAQVNAQGRTSGAEALMRWEHPTRGLVSPADFIPIAERTGLIVELDQWMLRTAFERVSFWAKRGNTYTISVNISPRFLQSPNFVSVIESLLKETQAPAELIVLEVTEGMLVTDVDSSIEKMKQLRKHGFSFSIDDFGTGYSSLSYIRKLPIQELKIDQSFIRGIPKVQADILMVESIVGVAHNANLRIVAEGIETNTQAEFCLERGLWGQGYFYGRPLPIEDWCRMNGC